MFPEQWQDFRSAVQKFDDPHFGAAMSILKEVLIALFGRPDMNLLCQSTIPAFLIRIRDAVVGVLHGKTCTVRCQVRVMATLRRILTALRVHAALIREFRVLPTLKPPEVKMLTSRQSRLPPQTRNTIQTWIHTLSQTTNNSFRTLHVIVDFLLKVCSTLGLNVNDWPPNAAEIAKTKCADLETIKEICGVGQQMPRKMYWLQLFFTNILVSDFKLPKIHPRSENMTANHDEHRIAKADLEALYAVAKQHLLDELFFLLLLTTGMRIGGLVKIEILHIAKMHDGAWTALDEGKTVEKGNRWFRFKLQARVKLLLAEWLNTSRTSHPSPYVFPGRARFHVSCQFFRSRFLRMCKLAGLAGKEFHLHALRHCYAHILHELGNSAETVSKLVNHLSVETTQKYYLKEDAAEVANRAIIPWLKCKRVNPVPNFLCEEVGDKKRIAQKLISDLRAIAV